MKNNHQLNDMHTESGIKQTLHSYNCLRQVWFRQCMGHFAFYLQGQCCLSPVICVKQDTTEVMTLDFQLRVTDYQYLSKFCDPKGT